MRAQARRPARRARRRASSSALVERPPRCRRRRTAAPAARPSPQPLPGAGLGREREHRVALVHERALGRDEVEPVADRVHEQHVGPAQQRDRPGEVVVDVEHDRLPAVGAPPVVDRRATVALDLARGRRRSPGTPVARRRRRRPRTRPARGAPGARRAGRRRRGTRAGCSSTARRGRPGRSPRGPHDRPRARASAAAHSGDAAAARMSSGSDASGDDERRRLEVGERAGRRCGSRRPTAGVWNPQARWAARPSSSSCAAASGSAPSHTGGANGVWLKCTHARSGRVVAQPGRHQAQVVVLHEHGRALGRHLGHRVGEGVVHRAVGVPRVGPATRRRPARGRGPTGRGARTRAPRCSPRRRRGGRSRGRGRAAARGTRRPRPRPALAASRSPSDMAAASQVTSPSAAERPDARHQPAGAALADERAVVRRARTTPGRGSTRATIGRSDEGAAMGGPP